MIMENHWNIPCISSGRKRVLSSDEEKILADALDQDPELSNEELAVLIDYKVAPRTISHYLHRQEPPFVRKVPADEEPIDESKSLQEEKKFLNTLRRYKNSIRIYQDESFIYENERTSWIRARKGRTVHRKRKRTGKKYSFAISMTNAGLLHPPYLIDSNFDDDRFLEYVEDELA